MASDKAIRAKYLFLVVSQAMKTLGERPTRAQLELKCDLIHARHPEIRMPADDLLNQPGLMIGRITTMAYRVINNFELGDYSDRKLANAARTSE
jgi:hypothetical protein